MEFFHAASLFSSDGTIRRFGPDEASEHDVPNSFETATQIPGGYGGASVVLPRPPALVADDAALFSGMEFYSPFGTFYEGRVTGIPQVGVDVVQINLEGWSAALDDDETFHQIFIDRLLSKWTLPGLARQDSLSLTFGLDYAIDAVYNDAGVGLELMLTGQLHAVHAEAIYDAGPGAKLGRLVANVVTRVGVAVDGNLNAQPRFYDDPDGANSNFGADYRAASSIDFTPPNPQRVAALNWYWIVPGSPGAVSADDRFRGGFRYADLFVLGDHGLTLRGASPAQGFYASDVIAYLLDGVPELSYVIGDSVEAGGTIISQLAPSDPGTRRSVIESITSLGGASLIPNDWGVYDKRQFFWLPTGTYGRTWRVRADETALPTSEGPDSTARCTGYMITFQDASGHPHSVGPPGSHAEIETTDLLDSSAENPAGRLSRRWKHRDIGQATADEALAAGMRLLRETNQVRWHGTVEVTGDATDEAGNVRPVCMMRAGDYLLNENDDFPEARPIASTSYTSDMKVKCDIGVPPNRGDVFLAQIAAGAEIGVQ